MKPLRRAVTLLLLAGASLALAATASRAADVSGQVATPAGDPVAGAIVFLKAGTVPEPSGERAPAIMDQVDKQFVPHVLPIVVGTPVRFPNHDQIHHHVYSFSRLMSFDLPLYRDEEPPPVPFDRPGVVRVGCNIHDWMSGVIVVLPTPYFATTDASGAFVLKGVPEGAHQLVAWHERSATKLDDTAQSLRVGATPVSGVRFELPLEPERPRTHESGGRDYR